MKPKISTEPFRYCVAMAVGFAFAWILAWFKVVGFNVHDSRQSIPSNCTITPIAQANITCLNVTKRAASRPLIMNIGDSITQYAEDPGMEGWATLLRSHYMSPVDIVNRGFGGWNTRNFKTKALPLIVDELRLAYAPIVITVWYGANDAALSNGPSSAQHVPLDEYRSNLIASLYELRVTAPSTKLLLITPIVVDDEQRRARLLARGKSPEPLDRTNEEAGKYAAACVEVAASFDDVAVLNLHQYFMTKYPNATERGRLLDDGLHLNSDGNRIVALQISEKLASLLTPATAHATRV